MTNNSFTKYPEMDYFMNKSLSDFIFIVEEKEVPVLKSFLSVKSEVFRAMFFGNFKESEDKELVIEDTTYEGFKTFLRFLYCDELVLNNENDLKLIEDIYKLSDKYGVLRLKKRVTEYLLNFKMDFTVWKNITIIAFKYELEGLKEKVLTFMENNMEEFIKKDIIYLNDLTNNRFLQLMAKMLSKTFPNNPSFGFSSAPLFGSQFLSSS